MGKGKGTPIYIPKNEPFVCVWNYGPYCVLFFTETKHNR